MLKFASHWFTGLLYIFQATICDIGAKQEFEFNFKF